jgi:hypothetical protein
MIPGDESLSVFNDRTIFKNWLQSQPREVLTLLAARAALRVGCGQLLMFC